MNKMKFAVVSLAAASLMMACLGVAVPVGARDMAPADTQHAKKITVGLVTYRGGINDKLFNQSAYRGLKKAEKKLGVKGTILRSQQPSDYVPDLTNLVQQHMSLIVAGGFLMENAVYHVAKQYPKRHFAIIDGSPANDYGKIVNLPNVANLLFKTEQSGYLVGVIAGSLEKRHKGPKPDHNTIGMVGGANLPPVTDYMCGYIEGARSVDKKIKILSDFDNGQFSDTANAKNIALGQISQGADILFPIDGHAGLGYLTAVKDQGRYGIGVNSDQSSLGKYIITSALKKVGQAVFLTAKRFKDHRYKAGDNIFSLKNGGTGFASDTHHVGHKIKKLALKDEKRIKAGKIKIDPNWGTQTAKGSCQL